MFVFRLSLRTTNEFVVPNLFKRKMVHDHCACPRDIQTKIWTWRVHASQAHVDYWTPTHTSGCAMNGSFYPENLIRDLNDFDMKDQDKDMYFLHQKRLFFYREKEGTVTEYNPQMLRFQQNDVELCNVIYCYMTNGKTLGTPLDGAIRERIGKMFRIEQPFKDDQEFCKFVDKQVLVGEETQGKLGVWNAMYELLRETEEDLEVLADEDGFNRVLRSFYTIANWNSWSVFEMQLGCQMPNPFDVAFISEWFYGTGYRMDNYVQHRSNEEQCKWYLGLMMNTLRSLWFNYTVFQLKVRSHDVEYELIIAGRKKTEITTQLT